MNSYQERLKNKMDQYVHFVYKITRNFPKEEIYSSASQLRRSSLSIILNYIEGYARKKILVRLNFLEISFGSLQESKYLIKFALEEGYFSEEEYSIAVVLAEEISAMLWTEISNLSKSVQC